MKNLKFYKENTNRWYIDLPEWEGSKAELEMVAGADVMLEHMANGNNEVFVNVSEEEFDGSDALIFLRLATELENGAFYMFNKYKGADIDLEVWLCDVTKFVFGDFPNKIFIAVDTLKNETKTSLEWESEIPKEFKLIIMDPDGWDRSNYEYSYMQEKITKEEFLHRMSSSTVIHKRELFDWLKNWK